MRASMARYVTFISKTVALDKSHKKFTFFWNIKMHPKKTKTCTFYNIKCCLLILALLERDNKCLLFTDSFHFVCTTNCKQNLSHSVFNSMPNIAFISIDHLSTIVCCEFYGIFLFYSYIQHKQMYVTHLRRSLISQKTSKYCRA